MAAIHASIGSGNWSAAGTWDEGVPHAGDSVVISPDTTVTFDAAAAAFELSAGCTLTIDGDPGAAVFTINAVGFTTAVGSTIVINAITSGNLDCNVAVAFNGAVTGDANASITVSGNITIGPSANFSGYSGSFTRDGAETPTTITNNNTVAANAPPLIINAAGTTTTAANAPTWKGFTLTNGTYVDAGYAHSIRGHISIGGTLTSTGTWTPTASGQLKNATGANAFGNFTMGAAGVVTTLTTGAHTNTKKFTRGAGTLALVAEVLIIKPIASDFWVDNNAAGSITATTGRLVVYVEVNRSQGVWTCAGPSVNFYITATKILTATGAWNFGTKAVNVFATDAGTANVVMGANKLTAGAVRLGGYGSQVGRYGSLDLNGAGHKITTIGLSITDDGVGNTLKLGSCYLELAGAITGTNGTGTISFTCTPGAARIQGGAAGSLVNCSADPGGLVHCFGTAINGGGNHANFAFNTTCVYRDKSYAYAYA